RRHICEWNTAQNDTAGDEVDHGKAKNRQHVPGQAHTPLKIAPKQLPSSFLAIQCVRYKVGAQCRSCNRPQDEQDHKQSYWHFITEDAQSLLAQSHWHMQ